MSHDKNCFVISPIGESESETRKRSDQVLKFIIRPAVESCGYKAIRADEIDKPGMITSQVIQHVVNDPLVVADLTERNPNVFYELAIRHALRKPLVQIIRKGDSIPFDVAGTRTIYVDHKDLESVDLAKTEIVNQIKALEKGPGEIETPISVSIDLQSLKQSEKPEERKLADLLASVVDLRSGFGKLEAKIGTKEQLGILDEIQSDLRALPARIDDYFDSSKIPWSRRGKIHPMMIHDLVRFSDEKSPAVGILVLISVFRDSAPWIYELGLELYRLARQGNSTEMRQVYREFKRAVDVTIHGPLSRELFGRNKEMFLMLEEIEPLLDRTLHMFDLEDRPQRHRQPRPHKKTEDGEGGDAHN